MATVAGKTPIGQPDWSRLEAEATASLEQHERAAASHARVLRGLQEAGCKLEVLDRLMIALMQHPTLVLDASPAKRADVLRMLEQRDADGTFKAAERDTITRITVSEVAALNTKAMSDAAAAMSAAAATRAAPTLRPHVQKAGYQISRASLRHEALKAGGLPPMDVRRAQIIGGAAVGAGMAAVEETITALREGPLDPDCVMKRVGVATLIGAQTTAILTSSSGSEATTIGLAGAVFLAALDPKQRDWWEIFQDVSGEALRALSIFEMRSWLGVHQGVAVPVVHWGVECGKVVMAVAAGKLEARDALTRVAKLTVAHACTVAGAAAGYEAGKVVSRFVPWWPLKLLVAVGCMFTGAQIGRAAGGVLSGELETVDVAAEEAPAAPAPPLDIEAVNAAFHAFGLERVEANLESTEYRRASLRLVQQARNGIITQAEWNARQQELNRHHEICQEYRLRLQHL